MSDNKNTLNLNKENIDNMTQDDLSEAKLWLFKENMRLIALQKELEEKADNLSKEEETLKREMKEEMRKLKVFESQLILQKKHMDDRLHILQRGFEELNADRAMFESKLKENENKKPSYMIDGITFFRGVDSKQKLKKRYKDLLKIFHPDNSAGDEETVLLIQSEYNELIEQY